jgi:ADP-ribose pyrophosphatase
MYQIRRVTMTVRGKEFARDVVVHPGSACVLGWTVEDKIPFVRQYRPGVERPSLELPGGRLKDGETPAEAATREMEAETGLKPVRVWQLGEFWAAPGYSTELIWVFVAEQLKPGLMRFDESEEMQLEFLAYSEALEKVRSGEIADARTIVALLRWGDQIFGSLRPEPYRP